jgi:hypothetical protein
MEELLHAFLNSELPGSGHIHAPIALTAWEKHPSTHCTGGCVCAKDNLDTVNKREFLTFVRNEVDVLILILD